MNGSECEVPAAIARSAEEVHLFYERLYHRFEMSRAATRTAKRWPADEAGRQVAHDPRLRRSDRASQGQKALSGRTLAQLSRWVVASDEPAANLVGAPDDEGERDKN